VTKFVAIDGEADQDGNYILLCDSLGRTVFNPTGVTTKQALEFILEEPQGAVLVCFGLNYDVNQWLRDLQKPDLRRMANEQGTTFRQKYKLEWIPGKTFTVKVGRAPGRTVCEVFGFFQVRFVKALQQWGFEPPAEIEQMKKRRGTFKQSELKAINDYCFHECLLLVKLMERLEDACRQANCVPRGRWIGAGAIASALLASHGCKPHHAYDVDLFGQQVTDDYILRAYFGGRVELYQQGWQADASSHDIRSAYPYAAMSLPSLLHASWEWAAHYHPYPHALWRVSWDIPAPGPQVVPFPVRIADGSICYPLSGEGVYHGCEVAAAMRAGFDVWVHDGVVLQPNSPARPFDWIPEVYEHRARFKADGNHAEKALKLGLNSVYGKMAQGQQQAKWRPPYQSYFWAGYVTAVTRARVLDRLVKLSTPVMTATDGIVHGGLSVEEGPQYGIGSWEHATYDRIATIQPGVYVAEANGERMIKSRGFFARDVNYDDLLTDFADDPMSAYRYHSRRFIGLKAALQRTDFAVWRQWVEEHRSVAFQVRNKQRVVEGDKVLLYPTYGRGSSLPYVPKQSLYDVRGIEQTEDMIHDDQPHREVD
jgi:hypothetical protein